MPSELTDEEYDIVLGALKCLHQLKYIPDIAIALKDNRQVLAQIVEELAKIKERMR